MRQIHALRPSRPVAFMTVLCLLMLVGELVGEMVFSGRGNPMAVAFYCFLPVVFWMIADKQKRDALAIAELEDRIDRLEAGRPVYEAGILV
jgi:hypothetical protein